MRVEIRLPKLLPLEFAKSSPSATAVALDDHGEDGGGAGFGNLVVESQITHQVTVGSLVATILLNLSISEELVVTLHHSKHGASGGKVNSEATVVGETLEEIEIIISSTSFYISNCLAGKKQDADDGDVNREDERLVFLFVMRNEKPIRGEAGVVHSGLCV
nr:hypothetical protein Iba_chr12eCG6960 [Ipomoea batatas]